MRIYKYRRIYIQIFMNVNFCANTPRVRACPIRATGISQLSTTISEYLSIPRESCPLRIWPSNLAELERSTRPAFLKSVGSSDVGSQMAAEHLLYVPSLVLFSHFKFTDSTLALRFKLAQVTASCHPSQQPASAAATLS